MSLIEKALRQLERDKQTVSLSAYSGVPRPSAAAEKLYEKADDVVVEHFDEERGEPRPWKQSITIGVAVCSARCRSAVVYPAGRRESSSTCSAGTAA